MSLEFYAGAVFTLGVALIGWWAADRGRWRRPIKSAERSSAKQARDRR